MKYDLKLFEEISSYTQKAVQEDRHYWKSVELPLYAGEPKILFLGTGGNPVNLLEQSRQTGGFILYLPGYTLAVDPGPAAIWHVKQNGVDMRGINGIYISHGHTDHYLGAPLLIEGMTRVMSQRRGKLMVPSDIVEESLISLYHQGQCTHHEGYVGGPEELIILQEGMEIELAQGLSLIPVKAYHGKNNFGFIIRTPEFTIGYTSDTNYIIEYEDPTGVRHGVDKTTVLPPCEIIRYRENLKEIFSKVDYLIANVSYFNLYAHRHITALGLAHLLKDSLVKRCLMTHFDACYTRPQPMAGKLAEFVTAMTGIECLIAEDNREYIFAQALVK